VYSAVERKERVAVSKGGGVIDGLKRLKRRVVDIVNVGAAPSLRLIFVGVKPDVTCGAWPDSEIDAPFIWAWLVRREQDNRVKSLVVPSLG